MRSYLRLIRCGLVAMPFMLVLAGSPATAQVSPINELMSVSVDPSADVPSPSEVTVTWTGATPGGGVAVAQCHQTPPGRQHCNSATAVITESDGSGAGSAQLPVTSGAVGDGECTTTCYAWVADFTTASGNGAQFSFAEPEQTATTAAPTTTTTAGTATTAAVAAGDTTQGPLVQTGAAVAAGDTAQGQLPETGAGSPPMLVVSAALLATGGMLYGMSRRSRIRG